MRELGWGVRDTRHGSDSRLCAQRIRVARARSDSHQSIRDAIGSGEFSRPGRLARHIPGVDVLAVNTFSIAVVEVRDTWR